MTSTTTELIAVLDSLSGVFDGEEVVDEYHHALQCAQQARSRGADDEIVTAALLHDVARSPLVRVDYPDVEHEIAASKWLTPRFGDRVAWLAHAHVAAKIYLVANEVGYEDGLSPA